MHLKIYLSGIFNSCCCLPETKCHSSLFLHLSGPKSLVVMTACTPFIHVFLGSPWGKNLSGIKCCTNTIGRAMPIRIIGDPGNQRPDKWSSPVCRSLRTAYIKGNFSIHINPLNPELNPICCLLALLAHHFLHVSRIIVKSLTLRQTNVIYIWSTYS